MLGFHKQARVDGAVAGRFNEALLPVFHSLMEDPVVAEDGHTYEREGIEGALQVKANMRVAAMQPRHSNDDMRSFACGHP